ncbi:MAG: iron-sulfur cluster assembly scaffold protein, partial [Alphaproteobacteria bacterium]
MNAPLYTTEILRLAASLPEPRPLQRTDGSASLRSPTCGSTLEVDVQLDAEGRIEAVSQRVHACAFGQAAAALAGSWAVGKSRAEVRQSLAELAGWLEGSRNDPPSSAEWAALAPALTRKSRHGAI